MAQSNLYKFGDSTAQTVEVTSDDARDLGDVDVKSFNGAIDISDDANRLLGETTVENVVATSPNAPTGVEDAGGTQINPATEATLQSVLGREVSVWSAGVLPVNTDSPVAVEDAGGTTVNPATEEAQGNWASGHDETVSLGDTNVTTLPAGAIPDGVTVVVQADPDNTDPVKMGLTGSPAVRVTPGASFTAQPADRSQIRVQAETAGDDVHITHEAN